uniref:Uncharacterized protein n=1 Tax=Triticum urartu TaxID=4572 RepID=A0A8R7QTB3_TRIUA
MDEEQDCRECAQVQHKGIEADILLLSPPPRRRLSGTSSGLGTSCCCLHPVQSSSGLLISSLSLRDLLQWMMHDSLVLFIMILNEGEKLNHWEEKSGR